MAERDHTNTNFLSQLNEALQLLADPIARQQTAMQLLATHLGVMRAAYYKMDPDQDGFCKAAGYEKDAIPLPDRMRMSDFGTTIVAAYRAGHTVFFDDTETDPQLESQRAAYQAIGVRAWVGVPLVKNGQLIAILGVHSATARNWTNDEIHLLEEVAEHTWATAQRG